MVSVQYLFPILLEALILYAVLYQLLFCCPVWFVLCVEFSFFVILFILFLISDWNSSSNHRRFVPGNSGNSWDDGETKGAEKKGKQINFFLSLSGVVL